MFEHIISIIAPHHCLSCNKEGLLICYDCQFKLPENTLCYNCRRVTPRNNVCTACKELTYLDGLYAKTFHEAIAKDLVHKYKFERAKSASETIAMAIAQLNVPPTDWITYLPTASSRVRMRGYDQARLVARVYARGRKLPYDSLLRRRGQLRQLGKSGAERRQQLRGSFYVPRPQLVEGKTIILIDDVITTGSSINEAAVVLKKAGAKKIYALVFAMA